MMIGTNETNQQRLSIWRVAMELDRRHWSCTRAFLAETTPRGTSDKSKEEESTHSSSNSSCPHASGIHTFPATSTLCLFNFSLPETLPRSSPPSSRALSLLSPPLLTLLLLRPLLPPCLSSIPSAKMLLLLLLLLLLLTILFLRESVIFSLLFEFLDLGNGEEEEILVKVLQIAMVENGEEGPSWGLLRWRWVRWRVGFFVFLYGVRRLNVVNLSATCCKLSGQDNTL